MFISNLQFSKVNPFRKNYSLEGAGDGFAADNRWSAKGYRLLAPAGPLESRRWNTAIFLLWKL